MNTDHPDPHEHRPRHSHTPTHLNTDPDTHTPRPTWTQTQTLTHPDPPEHRPRHSHTPTHLNTDPDTHTPWPTWTQTQTHTLTHLNTDLDTHTAWPTWTQTQTLTHPDPPEPCRVSADRHQSLGDRGRHRGVHIPSALTCMAAHTTRSAPERGTCPGTNTVSKNRSQHYLGKSSNTTLSHLFVLFVHEHIYLPPLPSPPPPHTHTSTQTTEILTQPSKQRETGAYTILSPAISTFSPIGSLVWGCVSACACV